MKLFQKLLISFTIFVVAFTSAGSVMAQSNFAKEKKRSTKFNPNGEIYYTATNLWCEYPKPILSTNFHRGEVISAGTKVTIDRYKRTRILFTTENNGIQYTFVHSKKHSTIKMREFFNRYFSKNDVMAAGDMFSKLTKMEQDNVKKGTVAVGMSKKAVLMAYGYPPTHVTLSLNSNVWTYWISRGKRMEVYFADDKVTNIEG